MLPSFNQKGRSWEPIIESIDRECVHDNNQGSILFEWFGHVTPACDRSVG